MKKGIAIAPNLHQALDKKITLGDMIKWFKKQKILRTGTSVLSSIRAIFIIIKK